MKHIIYLIIVVILFASCKKKDINESVTSAPIFEFKGIIGSDSVNIQAGVNRYYMFTTYFKDTQNLYTVKGYFMKDSCINCEPYLSFEAKDNQQTNGQTWTGNISQLLGNVVFNSFSLDSIINAVPTEIFTFAPDSTNPVSTQYFWDFGDGTTSTLNNPTHIFPISGGISNVKLKATYNGMPDSIINAINIDFNSTCRTQFTYTYDSSTNVASVVAPAGFTTYNWNFGNGGISSNQNDTSSYFFPGKYQINLTTTKSGCTASSFSKNILIPNSNNVALANFNYSTTTSTISNATPRINSSAFIITWKNNGKTYYSFKNTKSINQSNKPIFTATGFSLYSPNEKGDKTAKITGMVDTYLYNYANPNDSIKIKSTSLIFAVAYPN